MKALYNYLLGVLFLVTGNLRGQEVVKKGKFIELKNTSGKLMRAYSAGPQNAKQGILLVHDFFGISNATKSAADLLGSMGYHVVAVDLYNGISAVNNEEATQFMNRKDKKQIDTILKAGIEYLKRPGRKLATIGFSAGAIDAINAVLIEPELFSASVVIYGGGYDKLPDSSIDKLKVKILAISGSKDQWPVDAALTFFIQHREKSFELYFYPGADHGYAQPLFLDGKNVDHEATRVTWLLIKDFLKRTLND